jgi:hypothetical protein
MLQQKSKVLVTRRLPESIQEESKWLASIDLRDEEIFIPNATMLLRIQGRASLSMNRLRLVQIQ